MNRTQRTLVFRPTHAIDVRRTLAPLKRGRLDSTAVSGSFGVWRATRTPDGAGVQHVRNLGADIEVSTYGPGADWLIERSATLVGSLDDCDSFPAVLPALSELHRRFRSIRFCCTHSVWEVLLPSVLEQKVTGKEARDSYAHILKHFSEPAPSPSHGPLLSLPPAAAAVADAPSHVFHAANVERKRSDAIRVAATYARQLTRLVDLPLLEAKEFLAKLPGIGIWTVNEISAVALGDADAVSVGDYHLKNLVSWNLAREPRGTDERMIELLAPYRPHRGRVIRYLQLGAPGPPRYGPRLTIQKRF